METITASDVTLRAADGHALSAYRAAPARTWRGGVVLLHEIFGVNPHIREVVDGYARRGYLTISPALFDRAERGVEMGYDHAAVSKGRDLRNAIPWDATLLDLQAAIDAARVAGPVAVIGYCWGASLAFLSTTRLDGVTCAVGYYGAQTMPFAHEKVRVPLMLHFGELDPRIPPDDIATIRRHNPQIEMHSFPADHGFNCDHRKEWHAESAERALRLTLGFLQRHMRAPAAAGEVTTSP
jgi:carboxymethylenebutenolidase